MVITGGLWGYNTWLEKQVIKTEASLSTIKQSINEVQRDPQMQAYIALKQHANVLDDLSIQSHITKYIDHIDTLSAIYGVSLRKFAQSGNDIRVQAVIESDETGKASEKLTSFLRKYEQDSEALLKF